MSEDGINVGEEAGTPELLSPIKSLALGDSYFVDANYEDAANAYAACIISSSEESGKKGEQEEQEGSSSSIIYVRALSHRSEAFYRLGRYEEALEDARNAIRKTTSAEQKQQQSALIIRGLRRGETELFHKRAGNATFALQRYEEAKEHYERASELASLNQRPTVSEYDSHVVECIEKLSLTDSKTQSEEKKSKSTSSSQPPASPSKSVVAAKEAKITPTSTSSSPAKMPPATTTKATNSSAPLTMPKYQYYQSDNVMTISLLEPNVKAENLDVQFEKKRLVIKLTKSQQGEGSGLKTKTFTVIAGTLYSEVVVDRCKIVIKDEKVLIKLRKKDKFEWHELLNKKDDAAPESKSQKTDTSKEGAGQGDGKSDTKESDSSTPKSTTTNEKKSTIPRPYASHKDWNKIEADIKKEEDEETGEGDEALNKLFKQIYGNADDDTRRAMIKSYQTSGGTVLSTNWDEVSKKDYEKERTAPKGMEWKNWEGDKLPMEDND